MGGFKVTSCTCQLTTLATAKKGDFSDPPESNYCINVGKILPLCSCVCEVSLHTITITLTLGAKECQKKSSNFHSIPLLFLHCNETAPDGNAQEKPPLG